MNRVHNGTSEVRWADSAHEKCLQPRTASGGYLLDPAPPAMWSHERSMAQCMWYCWSRSREWRCWRWSVLVVSDGSCCSVGRCARCQEEFHQVPTGSCGLDRRRCWVQCSRYSDGGRTKKTQAHREPAGTPVHSLQFEHNKEKLNNCNLWLRTSVFSSVLKKLKYCI